MRRWMASLLLAVGLLGSEAGFAQSADLVAELSASPTAGLVVGSEFIVTATARNAGPNAASSVFVQISSPPAGPEGFYFDVVGVEAGACTVDSLDFEPPTFNVYWVLASLAADSSSTCVIRFRVRTVPTAGSTPLQLVINSSSSDPAPQNNATSTTFTFSTLSAGAVRVPSLGHGAAALLILGALLIAALMMSRGKES